MNFAYNSCVKCHPKADKQIYIRKLIVKSETVMTFCISFS